MQHGIITVVFAKQTLSTVYKLCFIFPGAILPRLFFNLEGESDTIMKTIHIGIICPSEIASRRFLPAVSSIEGISFVGVAVNSIEERYGEKKPSEDAVEEMLTNERQKAQYIIESYGGKIYDSYASIVSSDEIDVLYIPLPPALHYRWAKKALECGKHVLVEKPATISLKDTVDLINIAKEKQLALHENYMFIFHKQLQAIRQIVESGELGDVRLYRISFGFPMRQTNDFRYNKSLGGGALLDAGGYTIKYASYLLGDAATVRYAQLNNLENFEVDMFGSGALVNEEGVTAQIAFGMDNEYKCELEIWGSKGTLTTGRILTAPVGFTPTAKIVRGGIEEIIDLPADDAFRKSICRMIDCMGDSETRTENYDIMLRQAELVESFLRIAGNRS